jgi:hemerythrin-like domain-containing protein
MKSQPIKRSEALKVFSREHHFGLLFSWKIKQGIKLKVETARMLSYVNYFWECHLQEHFKNEETLLFNRIDAEVCTQAKLDHQLIVKQIAQANNTDEKDYTALIALIELLDAHIRYEERVVFPYFEANLSATLVELMRPFLEQHDVAFNDDFKDEFWK